MAEAEAFRLLHAQDSNLNHAVLESKIPAKFFDHDTGAYLHAVCGLRIVPIPPHTIYPTCPNCASLLDYRPTGTDDDETPFDPRDDHGAISVEEEQNGSVTITLDAVSVIGLYKMTLGIDDPDSQFVSAVLQAQLSSIVGP